MSFISGLVELWLAGEAMSASRLHVSRIMNGVASILCLVVVSSILGLMATGCVYVIAYMSMLAAGLTPMVSLLILLGITLIALIITITVACAQWKRLSKASERLGGNPSPIPQAGKKILYAFLEGFKGQKTDFGAS